MVKAPNQKEGRDEPPKCIQLNIRKSEDVSIEDSITNKTMNFFLKIPQTSSSSASKFHLVFCILTLSQGNSERIYREAIQTVEHLKVVNNKSERCAAHIEEGNVITTMKKEQKQFPQVVQDHRSRFANSKKERI